MITPEEFKVITDKIDIETQITTEDASTLLQTILELDASLVIIQNALELAVTNAQEVIPAVAEHTLKLAGRTDTKAKKKAANFAGEITARFELAIQMYLAGAFEEAQKILATVDPSNDTQPDESTTTNPEEETTNE